MRLRWSPPSFEYMMNSARSLAIMLLARLAVGLVPAVVAASVQASTNVTIQGEKFLINGVTTFAGGRLEGTLPNSRMVQATFDDANPNTIGMWKYPDGKPYSATRQTNEFIAALPVYRVNGLLCVTLSFQGGAPTASTATPLCDNTAFNSDGSLKAAYLSRMDAVIRALDAQGMVAILSYFYFGQDQRLANETAIKNAVTNATQWVLSQGYTNVLIEIVNEADANGSTTATSYQFPILGASRIGELISAVRTQSTNYGRRLNVSASLIGGHVPNKTLAQLCDFVLLHGNTQTSSTITSMVNSARGYGLNKPIVFNEDSATIANFKAATAAHASWGYFDAGTNNYIDGFQSPPTNWGIQTPAKQNFFNQLAAYAAPNPATLVGITRSATAATVTFQAVAGVTYRLERKTTMSDTTWHSISGVADFAASRTGISQIVDTNLVSVRFAFYRVSVLP
jgi:hypothetical protein